MVNGLFFPTPEDLSVTISLDSPYLNSEAYILFMEIGSFEEIGLSISVFPHQGNRDFVRSTTTTCDSTGYPLSSRSKNIFPISETDPLFRAYAVEKPKRLHLVDGTNNYRYIIGEKSGSVFVDGWLKEAQSPSWRVKLPVTKEEFDVLSSRLLIFSGV